MSLPCRCQFALALESPDNATNGGMVDGSHLVVQPGCQCIHYLRCQISAMPEWVAEKWVEVSLQDCSAGWQQKAMIYLYQWISRTTGPDMEQIATSPSSSLGTNIWDGVRVPFWPLYHILNLADIFISKYCWTEWWQRLSIGRRCFHDPFVDIL